MVPSTHVHKMCFYDLNMYWCCFVCWSKRSMCYFPINEFGLHQTMCQSLLWFCWYQFSKNQWSNLFNIISCAIRERCWETKYGWMCEYHTYKSRMCISSTSTLYVMSHAYSLCRAESHSWRQTPRWTDVFVWSILRKPWDMMISH